MYRVKVGYRFSCRFFSWEETSKFVHELIESMEEDEDVKVEKIKTEDAETEEE